MQEQGLDDGRFVLIEHPSHKPKTKSEWTIHDMAVCGRTVGFFSTTTKGGHWRDPEDKAREVCARMNQEDRDGLR